MLALFSMAVAICGAEHLYGDDVANDELYIANVYIATGICGNDAMQMIPKAP